MLSQDQTAENLLKMFLIDWLEYFLLFEKLLK